MAAIKITKDAFETLLNQYKENISKELMDCLDDDNFAVLNEKIMKIEFPEMGKKKKAKKVKSDEPKMKSGYILFSSDFRKTVASKMKSTEIMKEAGIKWKTLDNDTKTEWAEKAKQLYAEAVEEYKKTHPDYNPEEKKKKNEKKSKEN